MLNFYERDDISRQAPGKRDTVTVNEGDKKTKKQKRHMNMSIMEEYALWRKENPDIKLEKSKFATLRPDHALLTGNSPRNVCVCRHHENSILLLEGLHRYKCNFPLYHQEFPSSTVCAESSDDCWYNKCEECMDGAVFKVKYPFLMEVVTDADADIDQALTDSETDDKEQSQRKLIRWYQWEKITSLDGKERLEKIVKIGEPIELYTALCEMLPVFNTHHFIKGKQSKHYLATKAGLCDNPSTSMIQIDFAENYSTFWQDEIQSAHWNKTQVTILTAVYWHGENCKSAVVVSDDHDHSKDSVIVFLDHLITSLIDHQTSVLQIWSDGPSSQDINRFIAAAISKLEEKHNIQIIWNFFAASHGKGPVDAIGGMVKRQVATRVNQRRAVVKDAETFFQCALDTFKTTNVYYISDERVKELVEKHGLKNTFQTAPALPGIFNAHQFKVVDHKVEMRSYSTNLSLLGQKQNVPTKVTTIPAKEVIIKCGSFVLLSYDFAMYSGSAVKTKRLATVVKSVHGDGNKINVCYGKALTKKKNSVK